MTSTTDDRGPVALTAAEVYVLSHAMRGEPIDSSLIPSISPLVTLVCGLLSDVKSSERDKQHVENFLNLIVSASDRQKILDLDPNAAPDPLWSDTSAHVEPPSDLPFPSRSVTLGSRVLALADGHAGKTYVKRRWLIERIIRRGQLVALVGLPKIGKSTLAQDMALTLAQSLADSGESVIYWGMEANAELEQARDGWYSYHGIKSKGRYLYRDAAISAWDLPTATPEIIDAFIALVKAERPALIIMDPYSRLLDGVNDTIASEVFPALQGLERIAREVGCAILIIAHTNKGGNAVRGSGLFDAVVDREMIVHGDENLMELRCAFARDSRPFETIYLQRVSHEFVDPETGSTMSAPVLVKADPARVREASPLTENQWTILDELCGSMFPTGARNVDLSSATAIATNTLHYILKTLRAKDYVKQERLRWHPTEIGRQVSATRGQESESSSVEGTPEAYNWFVGTEHDDGGTKT